MYVGGNMCFKHQICIITNLQILEQTSIYLVLTILALSRNLEFAVQLIRGF